MSEFDPPQMDALLISADPDHIERERRKAKELKRTAWWRNRKGRGQCYYCKRRFPPAELTLDHITPLVRGGRTSKANCAPACHECNQHKRNLPAEAFKAWLQERLDETSTD
ncbi:HNH endonuclease [Magnetofaba australis]|uniref:Putative HNH nuclease n=1 Tax=Magnetofaba australis IT-1 TaxID=1434232 RepID=A0A1Y2K752_9PROT|nr:HNH endonuclease [Magnetofaba australis]OSM05188.1 putative HNH nuclease [Magnetofaba australis IT-1]